MERSFVGFLFFLSSMAQQYHSSKTNMEKVMLNKGILSL